MTCRRPERRCSSGPTARMPSSSIRDGCTRPRPDDAATATARRRGRQRLRRDAGATPTARGARARVRSGADLRLVPRAGVRPRRLGRRAGCSSASATSTRCRRSTTCSWPGTSTPAASTGSPTPIYRRSPTGGPRAGEGADRRLPRRLSVQRGGRPDRPGRSADRQGDRAGPDVRVDQPHLGSPRARRLSYAPVVCETDQNDQYLQELGLTPYASMDAVKPNISRPRRARMPCARSTTSGSPNRQRHLCSQVKATPSPNAGILGARFDRRCWRSRARRLTSISTSRGPDSILEYEALRGSPRSTARRRTRAAEQRGATTCSRQQGSLDIPPAQHTRLRRRRTQPAERPARRGVRQVSAA